MRGRITKKITAYLANRNKKRFKKKFTVEWFAHAKETIPVSMISYSGEKQLADQLYSMISFYANVGQPYEWILFSDGSHSKNSFDLLMNIPGVRVIDSTDQKIPNKFAVTTFPTMKKLFLYKSVEIKRTSIFVDSDILFYQSFKRFLPSLEKRNWFLVDEQFGYFDKEYVQDKMFDMYPFNWGALILNNEIDWTPAVDYLVRKSRQTEGLKYWSDQTALQILTRDFKEFSPLDPRYFIVGGNDAFKFRSQFDYSKIALRHFVGPVRHKMWQTPWRRVLSLK